MNPPIFPSKTNHLRCLLFCALLVFLSGCETKFDLPDNPPPIPECLPPHQIRLALVLGGGGAKGMSHVGVLAEFENAGIPIDYIVGCSAGSIVGVLYADCPNAQYIKQLLRPLRTWDILDINIWYGRYGLVRGGALRRFLKSHLWSRSFEELQIPCCVVATDVIAGEMVCLNSGPIIPAVHASSAVPFVFSPVYLHQRWLVDGGVSDPVPVRCAKKAGAAVIVAVDLSGLLPKTCPTNLFGVATRSAEIKFLLQSESCLHGADVIIKPELGDMGLFDDRNPQNVYEAGSKAAKEAIPQIIEILSQKGITFCKTLE
ncbi:MAG: patatin-like phospholipase family protein [Parachlamydiaceae bacterium]